MESLPLGWHDAGRSRCRSTVILALRCRTREIALVPDGKESSQLSKFTPRIAVCIPLSERRKVSDAIPSRQTHNQFSRAIML
jgi:hypothetical protein